MRATTAIENAFSFVGAGITSKKIETMPRSRKSGPIQKAGPSQEPRLQGSFGLEIPTADSVTLVTE